MPIALDGDVKAVVRANVVFVFLILHDMNTALAWVISNIKSRISIRVGGGKPVEAVVVAPFKLFLTGKGSAGVNNLFICVICIIN